MTINVDDTIERTKVGLNLNENYKIECNLMLLHANKRNKTTVFVNDSVTSIKMLQKLSLTERERVQMRNT